MILLFQLIVLDVIGIKSKHVPGHFVPDDHSDFLFRASRAFKNTNESIGIFILFVAFAILSSANPQWLSSCAIVYLTGRVAHMLFYYFNLKLFRSIAFAVSLGALVAMFIVGVLSWFQ